MGFYSKKPYRHLFEWATLCILTAQVGLAALSKGMRLIRGSPYATTEQLHKPTSLGCVLLTCDDFKKNVLITLPYTFLHARQNSLEDMLSKTTKCSFNKRKKTS